MARLDQGERPRRFYKQVSVTAEGEGHAVLLDARRVKSPAGRPLVAPTRALAGMLAAEWASQGELIDAAAMPANRLAFTALDRTPGSRAALAEEAARFAGADVLCYLAEGPTDLTQRESAAWGPWIAWAEQDLGVNLKPAFGVSSDRQDPAAIARVEALAAGLDDFDLTGLVFATALFGSAILAFAVQRGVLAAPAAFELSRLDEAFQEERWGVDAEAAARTAGLRAEAAMIGEWFAALRDSRGSPGSGGAVAAGD